MRTRTAAGMSTLGLLLTACGTGSAGTITGGECNASIGYQGGVYVTNTAVDPSAPRGASLGTASVLDCDQKTALRSVSVARVKGVDVQQAVLVVRGTYRGVYVAKGLPRGQWPSVLRINQ